jgi:hypothetical protein
LINLRHSDQNDDPTFQREWIEAKVCLGKYFSSLVKLKTGKQSWGKLVKSGREYIELNGYASGGKLNKYPWLKAKDL